MKYIAFFLLVLFTLSLAGSISEVYDGLVVERSTTHISEMRFDPIKGMRAEQYTTEVQYKILNNAIPKKYATLQINSDVLKLAEDIDPRPISNYVWEFKDIGAHEEKIITFTIKKKIELTELSDIIVDSDNKLLNIRVPENNTIGNEIFIFVTDEDDKVVKNIELIITHGSLTSKIKTDDMGVGVFVPEEAGSYMVGVGDTTASFYVTPLEEVDLIVSTIVDDTPPDDEGNIIVMIGLVLFGLLIITVIAFVIQTKFLSNYIGSKEEPCENKTDFEQKKLFEEPASFSINTDIKEEILPIPEKEESEKVDIQTETGKTVDEPDVYFIPSEFSQDKPSYEPEKEDKIEDKTVSFEVSSTSSVPFLVTKTSNSDVDEVQRLIEKLKKNRNKLEEIRESRHNRASKPAKSKKIESKPKKASKLAKTKKTKKSKKR